MIAGLLHPGRMGAAIGSQLVAHGHIVLWHPDGRSEATRHRAENAGLTATKLDDMIGRAEVVVSICPAAAATDIAELVARQRFTGIFVDSNAISPQRMREVAHLITSAGGTAVDAAISGPPPTTENTSATRIFLAGPTNATQRVDDLLTSSHIDAAVLGETTGSASAVKMAITSYLRTSRILTALAHALADEHDVGDALVDEARRIGATILADRDYLPSVAARAWRWEPEMYEVAATLDDAHLPTGVALATADVFRLLANDKDNWTITPEEMLSRLRSSQT